MFPHSELENYKLQVDLLQEKLKRSEDHRQHLEEKFDIIMRKRNEQEKIMKSEFRRKYQYFLDEQKERTKRNRSLIKMLDKVDQQAAELAARTERLKMLKLQYELYLTKMLQFQCMKGIESNPQYQSVQVQVRPSTINYKGQPTTDVFVSNELPYEAPQTEEAWNQMTTGDLNGSKNVGNLPALSTYKLLGSTIIPPDTPASSYDLQKHMHSRSNFGSMPNIISNVGPQMRTFVDPKNRMESMRFDSCPVSSNIKTSSGDHSNVSQMPIRSNADMTFNGKNFQNMDDQPPLTRINSEIFGEKLFEADSFRYLMSTPDKISDKQLGADYDTQDNDSIENVNDFEEQLQRDESNKMPENLKEYSEKSETQVPAKTTSAIEKKISLSDIPLETVLQDITKLSFDRKKNPLDFTFSQDNMPSELGSPIQFKKKEKLSIEKIENAIYGERIDPVSRQMNEHFMESENIDRCDQSMAFTDFKNGKTPQRYENKKNFATKIEPFEEKQDESEKVLTETTDEPSNEHKTDEEYGTEVRDENNLELIENSIDSKQIMNPVDSEQYENSYKQITYEEENKKEECNEKPEETYFTYDAEKQTKDLAPYNEENKIIEVESQGASNFFEEVKDENLQNLYDNSQYENVSYSYPNQTSHFDTQEYERPNEYVQQDYDQNPPQQFNFPQQPQQVSSEYNQDFVEENDYNYAYNPNSQDQFDLDNYQTPNSNYGLEQSEQTLKHDPSLQAVQYSEEPNQTEHPPPQELLQNPNPIPVTYEGDANNEQVTHQNESPSTYPESHKISNTSPPPNIVPQSILSTSEKQGDTANGGKKKKKVNFVDSETEENTSQTSAQQIAPSNHDESDFDFSSN